MIASFQDPLAYLLLATFHSWTPGMLDEASASCRKGSVCFWICFWDECHEVFVNVLMPFRRYGSIFSIMVGTKPLVVLNSYKLIKEALSKAEFSGRPNMFSGTFFQKGKTGVCTTEGSTWESQRSFLHSQMAQFASSKAFQVSVYCTTRVCQYIIHLHFWQEVVMDEIDDMKLELTKKVGEPVGLAYYLNVSLINCLWTIVSGRRLHAQQQVLPTWNV